MNGSLAMGRLLKKSVPKFVVCLILIFIVFFKGTKLRLF